MGTSSNWQEFLSPSQPAQVPWIHIWANLDEGIHNLNLGPPIPQERKLYDTMILLNIFFFKQEILMLSIDKPKMSHYGTIQNDKKILKQMTPKKLKEIMPSGLLQLLHSG